MNLNELDKRVAEDFRINRKSIFRSSFEIFSGNDAKNIRDELSKSLEIFPYLRLACMFQEFYDYTQGTNYRACWNEYNRRLDVEEIWRKVYGTKVSPYAVKACAWIISGECRGGSSDIWRVIKACASKKSEDGADHFDPMSYANDNVPRQLSMILKDYQEDGVNGREFVSFIEAYVRKQPDTDEWLSNLVDVAKGHFPKDEDFTADCYLKWDGKGSDSADIIFGVDHLNGREFARYSVDGKISHVTISAGFKPFILPPTSARNYKVRYRGKEMTIPSSPVGVYYRYVCACNPRRNWWKKVQEDGKFPHHRDELIVCLPYDSVPHPDWKSVGIDVCNVLLESITCAGKKYILYYCKLISRPSNGVVADVCGISTQFAGESPALRLIDGWAEDISADDAVVVEKNARIEVSDVGDDVTCEWKIDGASVCGNSGAVIDIPATTTEAFEKRVEVTLRRAGRFCKKLKINLFCIPKSIADGVRSKTKLPKGWSIEDDGVSEKYIANRVIEKKGVLLAGPNNVVLPIKIKDDSLAWWYESDTQSSVITGEFKEKGLFPRISDLEGCCLCVPADMKDKELELSGKKFRVGDSREIDGVIRIELDLLFENCGNHEFRYNGVLSELVLKLGGETICEVAALPKKPVLCRHAETGELGVFLPNRTRAGSEKFIALAYSDSIVSGEVYQIPFKLMDEALKWKKGEGDHFVSLESKLREFQDKKPSGDMFVVLVNKKHFDEYSCLLCNPFFLKDGVEHQLVFVRQYTATSYTDEEVVAIKQLRSFWSEDLDSLAGTHPLKKTRFARFIDRIRYEDCLQYWKNAIGTPNLWKQAFNVMLDSGFNPLMEPAWFNQDVDALFKITNKKRVAEILLDNQDAPNDRTMIRGEGLCAALVAKFLIEKYLPLVLGEGQNNKLMNREQTILSAKSLDRLGIYGVFKAYMDERPYYHILKSVNAGKMEFCGNGGLELIERAKNGAWKRTDSRIGKLTFVGFSLNDPNSGQEKLFSGKSDDVDCDENELFASVMSSDEFSALIDSGKRMAQSLPDDWNKRLFVGSFEAFEEKRFCDMATIRTAGLIVTLQSIISTRMGTLAVDKGSGLYDLMLRIVRKLFAEKYVHGNDRPWRELMRIVVAYLGIYSYLGIDVTKIENNEI